METDSLLNKNSKKLSINTLLHKGRINRSKKEKIADNILAFPRFMFQEQIIKIDEAASKVEMTYRVSPVLGSLGILGVSIVELGYATIGLLPIGLVLSTLSGIGSLFSLPFLLIGLKLKKKTLANEPLARAYLEIIEVAAKSNLSLLICEKDKYEHLKEQAQIDRKELVAERAKIIIPDNVMGQSRTILEKEQLKWTNKIQQLDSKIEAYENKLSAINQEIICQKDIQDAFEKYNSL